MPFNSATAAAAGRKGVKPRKDPADVRNKNIRLAVTQSELDMIDAKADAENTSRVELIVRAVKAYQVSIGQNREVDSGAESVSTTPLSFWEDTQEEPL